MTVCVTEVLHCSTLLGTMAVSNNRAVRLELLCNQLREMLTQSMAIQLLKLPRDL